MKRETPEPQNSFASMKAEEYIEQRLTPFRDWYDKKALKAKRYHQLMRIFTVIGGALVPVLINLPNTQKVTTGISILVVVLIAMEGVFHFREQWKTYRSTEQMLAKEYFLYATGQGHYGNIDPQKAYPFFVQNIEATLASEHVMTMTRMTSIKNCAHCGPDNSTGH